MQCSCKRMNANRSLGSGGGHASGRMRRKDLNRPLRVTEYAGVDHRRRAWGLPAVHRSISYHPRLSTASVLPPLEVWKSRQLLVVAHSTKRKRGEQSTNAIGYGTMLRCPCRSPFSSLIGSALDAQSQSASSIGQDVLADKHNPSVRHIPTSIRLNALVPHCELSLNLDIKLETRYQASSPTTSAARNVLGIGGAGLGRQRNTQGRFCNRYPRL